MRGLDACLLACCLTGCVVVYCRFTIGSAVVVFLYGVVVVKLITCRLVAVQDYEYLNRFG